MDIQVTCDRCRAAGVAGKGDFSKLLEFEPVPRPKGRVDGWTAEKQRAFTTVLAITGSPHRAAVTLGKSPKGAHRLREAEGSESFNAAWDMALAIAAQNGTAQTASAVTDAGDKALRRARAGGQHPAGGEEPEMSEADKIALIEGLFYKWLGKVEQEREARLAGDVVAADFYLRQTTFFEVTFDLMCSKFSKDAWQVMSSLQRGGHRVMEIAATPISQMLDMKRRELWAAMGEPERPEFPPARFLIAKPDMFLASTQQALSEAEQALPPKEQEPLIRPMRAEQAAAQAAWERGASSQ